MILFTFICVQDWSLTKSYIKCDARLCLYGGGSLLLVGILVMSTGHLLVSKIIQDSMTLTPGSQLTHMWLQPPVQSRLTVFGFHVANSEEVLGGA